MSGKLGADETAPVFVAKFSAGLITIGDSVN